MTLPRYEVTLPAEALRHVSAFTPVVTPTTSRWAASQAQGWTVTGQPGTRPIAAPYPQATTTGGEPGSRHPGGAGGAVSGGSRYMPAAWFPSLYYGTQRMWGAIGGVRIYSDNQIPIPTMPAADPRWVVPNTRKRKRWLLGRQLSSGPVLPAWPQWRG